MRKFHLSEEQRRILRAQLFSTRDIGVYRRALALLEVAEGRSPAKVSRSLGVSCSSVYNWLNAFAKTPHPDALVTHGGPGRSSLWTDALEKLLIEALQQTADVCGYRAPHWTVLLLQEHLHRVGGTWLSDSTIRRKLHEIGYVWGPFGYVLNGGQHLEGTASPDVTRLPPERIIETVSAA
jgi:transposase